MSESGWSGPASAVVPAAGNATTTAADWPDARRVWLTFDDGPDECWTPRILDVLASASTQGIFFMVGAHVRQHARLARRVVEEGHRIGNHTWRHRHPWMQSSAMARREVRDGASAIADITGITPRYFRPPFGRLRPCMVEEAAFAGQYLMLWTLSACDWGPFGSSTAIATRLQRAGRGDIVLMHDAARGINRPDQLIQALPELLERLALQQIAAPLPSRSTS